MGCSAATDEISDANMQLVWSDEFDYSGQPAPDKWSYDLGDGCPTLCGWGNNEKQYYTQKPENIRVKEGLLIIEALKNRSDSLRPYSSARLVSKNKGEWKYGKIEVSARLPRGRGTWPAIWMLPTDWKYGIWPKSGEIDIMEHVGYDQNNVHGTVHTEAFNHVLGTQRSKIEHVETADISFHTYAINWQPDSIQFYIDNKLYFTFKRHNEDYKKWPFDQPFYLILNLAVGGNWGGKHGIDDSIWPQCLEVDYVRVYQNLEKGLRQ